MSAGQGGSISPKGYLVSPSGAAKAPFWDAPSEAAEAVRSRTGSVDQHTMSFAAMPLVAQSGALQHS